MAGSLDHASGLGDSPSRSPSYTSHPSSFPTLPEYSTMSRNITHSTPPIVHASMPCTTHSLLCIQIFSLRQDHKIVHFSWHLAHSSFAVLRLLPRLCTSLVTTFVRLRVILFGVLLVSSFATIAIPLLVSLLLRESALLCGVGSSSSSGCEPIRGLSLSAFPFSARVHP